jgi:hypothetical protein
MAMCSQPSFLSGSCQSFYAWLRVLFLLGWIR